MKAKFFVSRPHFYLCLLILSVCLVFSPSGVAKKKPLREVPKVLTNSQLFIEAERSFDKGNWAKFDQALNKLTGYPLYPYLLHKKLSSQVSRHRATSTEVEVFIQTYPDSLLSKQLANQWLALQFHQKNWAKYLSLYETPTQEEKDHKYQCYSMWAAYQISQSDLSELYPAIALWHSGLPQAQSCEIIFEELLNQNKLGYTDIWNRIEQALKKKQVAVAESASKHLSFEDKKLFRLWLKVHENPHLVANHFIFKLEDFEHDQAFIVKQIITYGMGRLAKLDVLSANRLYPDIIEKYDLSYHQRNEIAKELAIAYAKKRSPIAQKWFKELPENYQDIEYLAWKTRYALFKKDWNEALISIENLPSHEAKLPRWQYWKARALDEIGHKSEASRLFQPLFHEHHFYSFLAHHYCKHPLQDHHRLRAKSEKQQSLNYFHDDPSVARIKELMKLSRIQQAKGEWLYKVSLLSEDEKLEAARFAHRMQWHDLAMTTLSKAQHIDALILRFPLPHEPKIMHEATKHAIDPAWVFALTRQESSFIPYAQSPVGAMGLMQLMPRTAQEVAKTLKKRYKSKQDLSNPNLNIELGTAYLKNLHGFMQNNSVLATASYNAGPGRIKQWLPPHSMPADIWIENIPFEETRNYVQNIITYTGIYRSILGKAVDLENMLPEISG